MSAYRIALWSGFIYMWSLVSVGYLCRDFKHDNPIAPLLLVTMLGLLPFAICLLFCLCFTEDSACRFYITGIPAILGFLLQYFLLSFIPFLVHRPGVMVHIIGLPHPFDIVGQLISLLPILVWALFFPIVGRWTAILIRRMKQNVKRND